MYGDTVRAWKHSIAHLGFYGWNHGCLFGLAVDICSRYAKSSPEDCTVV